MSVLQKIEKESSKFADLLEPKAKEIFVNSLKNLFEDITNSELEGGDFDNLFSTFFSLEEDSEDDKIRMIHMVEPYNTSLLSESKMTYVLYTALFEIFLKDGKKKLLTEEEKTNNDICIFCKKVLINKDTLEINYSKEDAMKLAQKDFGNNYNSLIIGGISPNGIFYVAFNQEELSKGELPEPLLLRSYKEGEEENNFEKVLLTFY